MSTLKLGIIREGKTPPDSRVPLTPQQCAQLDDHDDIQVKVQKSPDRCYSNKEYEAAGVTLVDDITGQDVLLGVKEVPIKQLIPNRTYLFFSHTIKEQPYNRDLLRAVLEKDIKLIDYEVLTNDSGKRVIAFGRWAGIVGAHNALWAYGERSGQFKLKRAYEYGTYITLKQAYETVSLPPLKIVLTGGGRVSGGAVEVLEALGIERVEPDEFVQNGLGKPVYTQLDADKLYTRNDGGEFGFQHFFGNPELYNCDFSPYYAAADIMINGIFWDPAAPVFFTKADMAKSNFNLKVIADITCDIEGSVPSTIRPSTIDEPLYGFDKKAHQETDAFEEDAVTVMAVDNLPNELPRDASEAFGQQLTEYVIPELLQGESEMIARATITENGQLGKYFHYLQDFVKGN